VPVKCPECGRVVTMRERQIDSCETHGFDCGPFEWVHQEWWECPLCWARFPEQELVEVGVL